MKFYNILYMIMIFLFLSVSVSAVTINIPDHVKEKIPSDVLSHLDTVSHNSSEIIEYKDNGNGRSDFKVVGLERANEVRFNNIDGKSVQHIRFDKGYSTDIINVSGADLDFANITLEKYTEGVEIPFVMYMNESSNEWEKREDINLSQNSTHVWFNVENFSAWTSSLGTIHVINELGARTGDFRDFGTFEEDDYFGVVFSDPGTSSSVSRGNDQEVDYMISESSKDVLRVQMPEHEPFTSPWEHKIHFTPQDGAFYYDDWSFRIYNNNLIQQDSFNSIVEVRNWIEPFAYTLSPSSVNSNSAELIGIVDFGDYKRTDQFGADYFGSSSDVSDGYFEYREQGESSWTSTSSQSISNDNPFSESVSGLSDGTTYEYRTVFSYSDPISQSSTTVKSSIQTFTTASDDPTVQTLSAQSVSDTSAVLKGVAEFGEYSGTVEGWIAYRETGGSTWIGTTPKTINDGEAFSETVTGLTANTEYEFRAIIGWDSQEDTGDILTFTTNAEAGEIGLTQDLLSYWKFDENTGTSTVDSHGTNDGTLINSPSWITGKLNSGVEMTNTDSHIALDSYLFNPLTDTYTLTAWVYNTLDTTEIIYTSGTEQGEDSIMFFITDTNTLYLHLGASSGDNRGRVESTGTLSVGWNFVVLTGDKNLASVKMYINNGADTAVVDHTGDPAVSTANPQFGNGISLIQPIAGLDEIGIWNRALSSDEITELHNDGKALSYDNFDTTQPSVTSLEPSDIKSSSVILRGIGENFEEGLTYDGWFYYAKEGEVTDWSDINDVSSNAQTTQLKSISEDTTFSEEISNLDPEQLYEYRAVMENGDTYFGSVENFITLGTPPLFIEQIDGQTIFYNDTKSINFNDYIDNWDFWLMEIIYDNEVVGKVTNDFPVQGSPYEYDWDDTDSSLQFSDDHINVTTTTSSQNSDTIIIQSINESTREYRFTPDFRNSDYPEQELYNNFDVNIQEFQEPFVSSLITDKTVLYGENETIDVSDHFDLYENIEVTIDVNTEKNGNVASVNLQDYPTIDLEQSVSVYPSMTYDFVIDNDNIQFNTTIIDEIRLSSDIEEFGNITLDVVIGVSNNGDYLTTENFKISYTEEPPEPEVPVSEQDPIFGFVPEEQQPFAGLIILAVLIGGTFVALKNGGVDVSSALFTGLILGVLAFFVLSYYGYFPIWIAVMVIVIVILLVINKLRPMMGGTFSG